MSDVRSAVPDAEAYYSDQNSYANMDATTLQTTYDSGLVISDGPPTGIVSAIPGSANTQAYCISAVSGGHWAHIVGPGGQVQNDSLPRRTPAPGSRQLGNCTHRGRGKPRPLFLSPRRIPRSREAPTAGAADRKAMNATLSTRQIRLVAILTLVVVAVGGFLVVTNNKTATTTAPTTPARTTQATTTPTPSKTHTATPVPVNTHGLPVSVVHALQKHSVVVVSLTAPRGSDDQFTGTEAQAGANAMKVGYVSIDVFHQRSGTAILRKLGVVDTPEVLVVKRPGVITAQFKGFVDRDVVAQAVADAR